MGPSRAGEGSRTKLERVQRHGNSLGLPAETYRTAQEITASMFGLIQKIVGSKITAGHLRDLEVLFEAREDLLAEPEFAKECGTDETLYDMRKIEPVAELERFFEEFSHLTAELFRQIFEAQPDHEMVRLHHMIKGQFSQGYFVEKVERVIAYSYLQDLVASCVREHPAFFVMRSLDKVDKIPNRIGFIFANISLMALRQRNAVAIP